MRSGRDIFIVTNNPLVVNALPARYEVRAFEELSYREILIKVRDLVYAGHVLLTHPLAGSVKPNETPYKSVILSREPGALSPESADLAANAVTAYDKFAPRDRVLTEKLRQDFQLIDYTLLCGALDIDAAAGLSKQ